MVKNKAKKPEIFPPAPDHFSEESKALWSEHIPEMRAQSRIALLIQALTCLDIAEQARLKVVEEGLTVRYGKSNMPHVHPALQIRKENLNLAVKIFITLGLQKKDRFNEYGPFDLAGLM